MSFPLQLVLVLYWLSLSTWFGGVLFIAMAVPVIVRTMKESDDASGLDEDRRVLLTGTVIENLFAALVRIEALCAGVLLILIIAQWILIGLHGGAVLITGIIRSAVFLGAAILTIYQWRVLEPRAVKLRRELVASVDNPEALDPARRQFEQHSQEIYTLLAIQGFLLMGMILFSVSIG